VFQAVIADSMITACENDKLSYIRTQMQISRVSYTTVLLAGLKPQTTARQTS